MQFWQSLIFSEPGQLLTLAQLAEGFGYTGVVLPDHVALPERAASSYPYSEYELDPRAPFLDPWPAIAAMAAVTTRLRFSTYVYILPMRDPFSVAKQAGTVAMLSGYRFSLGVGAGWLREELELLGFDPARRGARMDEMIEVMRRFWSSGEAEFHGEFYDFDVAGMCPQPTQRIPIWVGGKSRAALRRAARNDGWLGMNYDLDEIDRLLVELGEARRSAADDGADPARPFETLVIPNAVPDRDLYARLADKGVTSTVCMGWDLGSSAAASLAAKRASMEAFAEQFLRP